ncbi:hypothetical protein K3495_g12775 [Podosphaera aphanis]|nr:hypothetical protein K3495_g12775 [Podosphaera aphanis]
MRENPNAKTAQVARQCKCQYSLLYNRSRGIKTSSSRGGHNRKLSEPEDQALQDYLLLLHYAGTPTNLLELEKAANRLLFFKGKGEIVSARWSARWMKHHPGFSKQLRAKLMATKRREAHLKEDIEHLFAEFARCVDMFGFQADDIYIFDETGFQIGIVAGERVFVAEDSEAAYLSDPDNRELVTVVATIEATGRLVPPMIIFKSAYHLRNNFDNDMDPDIFWARSESGFTNDRLGLKNLENFHLFTREKTMGAFRLLIFDGHGSHLTQSFADFCWKTKICLFLLPPYPTHVLQPLDVGVFSILKHNFKRAVKREVFLGATDIKKADFIRFFQRFYAMSVTSDIAISAFRKSGLVPVDSSYTLKKLKLYGEDIGEDNLAGSLDEGEFS